MHDLYTVGERAETSVDVGESFESFEVHLSLTVCELAETNVDVSIPDLEGVGAFYR